MRLLVDSQSLIWYVDQDHLLSPTAHGAITDPANDFLPSAATVWEVAITVGLKKLTLSLPYRVWMERAVAAKSLADIEDALIKDRRNPLAWLAAAYGDCKL